MSDGRVQRAQTGEEMGKEGEELIKEVRVQGRSQNFENLEAVDDRLSGRNLLLIWTCKIKVLNIKLYSQ